MTPRCILRRKDLTPRRKFGDLVEPLLHYAAGNQIFPLQNAAGDPDFTPA
jgi:hypothetical protein